MIEVRGLTKRFGGIAAVDDLSFRVEPGRVTGFLGPNGSGKSTTMRCMLGLDRADAGEATFGGRRYVELERPLREIGSLLDAGYVHPGRTGRNHLRWMAAATGLPTSRVDEVLELVGLSQAGRRKVRAYSLGMRQRLGLAGVMLGDPSTLILDEPANGLDPEGIRWIRDVLVHLARDGRSILVSSHLLSEMALMAQDLVVIGRGRLISHSTVDEFIAANARRWVRVRSPRLPELVDALGRTGATITTVDATTADVEGVAIDAIGDAAAARGLALHELSARTESLEDAFLKATSEVQEFAAGVAPVTASPLPPPAAPPTSPGGPPPVPPIPPGGAS